MFPKRNAALDLIMKIDDGRKVGAVCRNILLVTLWGGSALLSATKGQKLWLPELFVK